MPELPEVETVRRGLALKMSGRRILQAELRRPDLRRPFPPALAARLDGARIGALGRRGKYILIELDSDGLLLLHLGMSGPGHGGHRRSAGRAARPCRAEARRRHRHPLQRCAPLRADRLCQARRGETAPALGGARPGAARSRIRRRLSRRGARRQDDADQVGAARSADRRRARQHLCLRGAVPLRRLAATPRGLDRPGARASGWSTGSARS